jgi:hypothetical protein
MPARRPEINPVGRLPVLKLAALTRKCDTTPDDSHFGLNYGARKAARPFQDNKNTVGIQGKTEAPAAGLRSTA